MMDSNEWKQIPLEERLAYLVGQTDDPQVRDALNEVLENFSSHAVFRLQAKIAELETEVGRLERLAYAPTPY